VAFGHQLVTRRTTLLLRGFRTEQVTEARRAPHELALGGEFEPLGNGLLGLLHGERSKTETPRPLGKGKLQEPSSRERPNLQRQANWPLVSERSLELGSWSLDLRGATRRVSIPLRRWSAADRPNR